MNFNQDMISFICHMTKVDENKIRIHFIPRNSRQGSFLFVNNGFFYLFTLTQRVNISASRKTRLHQ